MSSLSQRTIANKLGVSQATVSLVVNDPQTPLIAYPTRKRVLDFCREHGYKIGNRRRATDYVGVLMDVEYLSGRSQIHHLLGGIHRAAQSMGKNIIFEQPYIDPQNLIRKAPFEGLIITEPVPDDIIAQLRSFVPIVLVNHFFHVGPSDCVVSDNEGGTYQAVEALARHGHRRILCFGNDPKLEPQYDMRSRKRLTGFEEACIALGLESEIVIKSYGDFTPEYFSTMAAEYLRDGRFTGVVAMHDFLGVQLLRAASDLGLNAPRDYSIIGFGDGEQCLYTQPQMASVAEEFAEMGQAALELLMHRTSDEPQRPTRKIVCATHLVERPSLGPAPGTSGESCSPGPKNPGGHG
jgi:LacI family transcriptional regulator